MRDTKQIHMAQDIDNAQEQAKPSKLNLDKMRVRHLVRVKSRIRTGVRGSCHPPESDEHC
jgi:hypothetical protein